MGLSAILCLLVVSATPGPVATVQVEGSTLAPALRSALTLELGPEALAPEGPADLRVRLTPFGEALRLGIRAADGTIVLERDLALDDGPAPALRLATVLVAEVARSRPAPPPAPPPPPPEPPPLTAPPPPPLPDTAASTAAVGGLGLGLRLAAGTGLLWWSRPASPRLGLSVRAAIEAPFGFLGVAATLGLGPELSTSELAAQLSETQLALELGWSGLRLGPLQLGVTGAVGYGRYQGEARALVYQGPATVSSVGPFELLGLRLMVEARYPFSTRFDLWAQAGAHWALGGGQVLLPSGYVTSDPVEVGGIGPWVQLGLGWKVF